MSLQILDCSLSNFKVPGLPEYTPLFGTKKEEEKGLTTLEIIKNEMMYFLKQRPIGGFTWVSGLDSPTGLVTQDSFAENIEFNATFALAEGVSLKLDNPLYEGQQVNIVASFDLGLAAGIIINTVEGIPKLIQLPGGDTCKLIAVKGLWEPFITGSSAVKDVIPDDPYVYYSCEDLPEIPDDPKGTFYKSDFYQGLGIWYTRPLSASNFITEGMSIESGKLKYVFTGNNKGTIFIDKNAGEQEFLNNSVNKFIIFKVSGDYNKDFKFTFNVYTETPVAAYENLIVPPLYQNEGLYIGLIPVLRPNDIFVAALYINLIDTATAPVGTTAYLDYCYIGDGSYLTTLNDNSGNNRHINLKGVFPIQGQFDKGIKFFHNELILRDWKDFTGDFTVSFWINKEEVLTDLQYIITGYRFKNTSLRSGWNLQSRINGAVAFGLISPTNKTAAIRFNTPAIPNNEWHHIIAKLVNGYAILKVDSQTVLNEYFGIVNYEPDEEAHLGLGNSDWESYPYFFNGMLDEIAIFERATTNEEDNYLFKNGLPKKAISSFSVISKKGLPIETFLHPKDLNPYIYCACDSLPEIPDNPAGMVYKSNFTSNTECWTFRPALTTTPPITEGLSVEGGKLKCVKTDNNNGVLYIEKSGGYDSLLDNCINKMIVYKLSGNYGEQTVLRSQRKLNDDTWRTDTSPIIGLGNGKFAAMFPEVLPDVVYVNYLRLDVLGLSTETGKTAYLDYCYIGDASYSSLLIDDSGNGRHFIPKFNVVPARDTDGRRSLFFPFQGGLKGTTLWQPEGSFTFSWWAKLDKSRIEANYYVFISNLSNASAEGGVRLEIANDYTLCFRTYSTVSESIKYPLDNIPDKTWVHLIAKYDFPKKIISLKLNTVEIGSLALSGPILWPTPVRPLYIGMNSAETNRFTGYLSDIAVFNRLTTDEEDNYLYLRSPEKKPITIDTIIESWSSGNSYYRKYLSGWVEQGGLSAITLLNTSFAISLFIPMLNENYYVAATTTPPALPMTAEYHINVISRTSTTFNVGLGTTATTLMNPIFWKVIGFRA